MDVGPLAVLTTEAFEQAEVTFAGRRTRFIVPVWRARLWLCDKIGRGIRAAFVDGVGVTTLLIAIAVILLSLRDMWTASISVAGGWILLLLLLATWGARQRVLIGEFRNFLEPADKEQSSTTPALHIGDLLLGEMARIVDLFHVVGDRRAVSSGLGPDRAFDATMSADGLLGTLRGAVSPESKMTLGPLTVPVAPVVALLGVVLQAPRLTGSLHRDGSTLILTAEMSRRRGLTWKVPRQLPGLDADLSEEVSRREAEEAMVTAMVRQLSLRIFTDVALGRSVRWAATEAFVEGLRAFRVCLRTPRDRKVNLKRAQEKFLIALSEDEDFPRAHYNLGVVYTELHGLAIAAGRTGEATRHLRAAETALGRAIEKDPTRWETYFAYAQTQFRYGRHDRVLELSKRMESLHLRRSDKAKVAELAARSLVQLGREKEANLCAREASRNALRALARARLMRRGPVDSEHDQESSCRELAAGCLLTFGNIFSRQMIPGTELSQSRLRRWRQDKILRRTQSIFKLAQALTRRGADVRFEFGLRALRRGRLNTAVRELQAAARSEPSRPTYSIGLALAYARRRRRDHEHSGAESTGPGDEIIRDLCWEAIESMAAAFSPAHDLDACEMLALVLIENDAGGTVALRALGTPGDLASLAQKVRASEHRAASEAAISSYFLKVLAERSSDVAVRGRGHFVQAIAEARRLLAEFEAQQLSPGPELELRGPAVAKLRDALRDADRASSLNPLSSLAWETLGDVYRALSDFVRARENWEYALAADPDNPNLYNKIGWSFWQTAFESAARISPGDLAKAAVQFRKALLLYGSENFDEQVTTHYRLGKLHAALREFADARAELRIVEAMDSTSRPPVVGWLQLGQGYLERQRFPECEHFFERVVQAGSRLVAGGNDCNLPVGEPVDEKIWPLGLVVAWAHLGLAFSLNKRDGDIFATRSQIRRARSLIALVDSQRHPSRALAACEEAEGTALLRSGDIDAAIAMLRSSLGGSPSSWAYLHLAQALIDQAGSNRTLRQSEEIARLLQHAKALRPTGTSSAEIDDTFARLANGR
jgi:tetratricopeptide (TPR) repeat protein